MQLAFRVSLCITEDGPESCNPEVYHQWVIQSCLEMIAEFYAVKTTKE